MVKEIKTNGGKVMSGI